MERRSSLRKPIHLDAVIRLDGGAKWPCVIADYCDKGMFLKFSLAVSKAIESDQTLGPARGFSVCFEGRQGMPYEIDAQPAHLLKGAAGIRFRGRFDTAVAALDEFSEQAGRKHHPQEEIRHIVTECVTAIQSHTMPLLVEFWPQLIADIKHAAVEAASDQLANATMEAANKLERETSARQQRFYNAIQDPLGQHLSRESAESLEHLSLIDKGAFEDWLTTRVLVTKAETLYRSPLLTLKMRLDELGLSDKQHHDNPLGPALIVQAFQVAVTGCVVESSIEKRFFRLFEKGVMNALEPLYDELNAILIRHDILPKLDVTRQIKKSPERQPAKAREKKTPAGPQEQPYVPGDAGLGDSSPIIDDLPAPQFSYGAPGMSSAPAPADTSSQTYAQPPFAMPESGQVAANEAAPSHVGQQVTGLVRSLRQHEQDQAPAQTAGENGERVDPAQSFSRDEISRGLQTLQGLPPTLADDGSRTQGLMARVLENLPSDESGQKRIHEDQQVAIDVVDRFFDSLNDNPRIGSLAKQQLHRLEVPVLKVLLQDEGFFDDGTSSVRAVMNRIAQLGAKGSRLTSVHQKRIENLVMRIVEEFEDDTHVFDQVLAELNELVDRQNQLYKKNVERVAAAAEGVHRVEQAKVAVARALNARLSQQAIPQAVHTLVQQGWQDLLNLVHIRQGEDSDAWRDNLAVLDELLAYGNDPDYPLDMRALLPRIQAGLKEVSGAQEAPAIVRDHLKQFIEGVKAGQFDAIEGAQFAVPESEDEKAIKNVQKSKELKHWILRAKSIAAGTWLQFNRPDEETQYMRLVWIAKGYSKFVCVNHQGMKVVELGLFKLATYLKDGIVMPDPDYEIPIVNQGLDDMVKDVYDKLAYDASHDKASGLVKRSEFCREVRALMKRGDKDTSCSLLYIRFAPILEDQQAKLKPGFARRVAVTMRELATQDAVLGRLTHTDFAMFLVDDELELINLRCSELLVDLCQSDKDQDQPLLVAVGESRGQLGFNNPESMIRHAARPIAEASQAHREARARQQEQIDAEADAGESTVAPAAAGLVTECVEVAEEDAQTQTDLSALRFDIFCQRAMRLANDSVHEEQYELVCSEAGTGLSFEPESAEQARALDQWWIRTLLARCQSSDPAWDGIDVMRVKLSGYAFQNDEVKDQLIALADSGQLTPRRIWFDVYDFAVVDNLHAAADMVKHLMMKGYRFCLDHFGTRRSPFPLLKVLPVDMIKIDEFFVEQLSEREAEELATYSIVELAHERGKEVLAAAVDSAICLQRMKALRVDYAQGSTISDYELLESEGDTERQGGAESAGTAEATPSQD